MSSRTPLSSPPDALDASLRSLHREVLDEAVPPSLLSAARQLDALQERVVRERRWLHTAAGFVVAVGMGWFAHATLQPQDAQLAHATVEREFVRQAGLAYSVYLPEKRHPVEVGAEEQAHLVQWLSKRLGKPLKVPVLQAQGFELVGGRLLPGDAGARAQFMFQDGQGRRLTLYLGSLEKTADKAATDAAQFRFSNDGAVPSFYWADQGFGYALSGQVDKPTLMALATSIYNQLSN